MFATLFFDEARANTSVLVRQRPSTLTTDGIDSNQGELIPYEEGSVTRYEGRSQASHHTARTPYAPPPNVPSYVYQNFTCHGSEPIPELRATLFWWLDDNRDAQQNATCSATAASSTTLPLLVHLMLVDDSESAREAHHSQTRMLTVELPIVGGRQALLTCGVSRLAVGGHCLAVAWMTRDLQAGYVRVTLQRNVNRASTLLMTSQGNVVQAEPLESLRRVLREETACVVQKQVSSASRAVVMSNQAAASVTASEFNADHWMLVSACVLAAVPVEERKAMAFFVLTSGVSVWRVQLYEDGSTVLASLSDPKHLHYTAVLLGQQLTDDNGLELVDEYGEAVAAAEGGYARNEDDEDGGAGAGSDGRAVTSSPGASSHPTGARSGWLARWVRRDGRRGGTVVPAEYPDGSLASFQREDEAGQRGIRRYLTVSAVSGSGYVTLVRASGHIEVLASDFELAERFAICRIPPEQARSLHRAARSTAVVQQWAALDRGGRCVHMLTCLGTQDNRRCIRSMVPAVIPNADNKLPVAVQCSYGLVPPTTMSSPISAAVDATGRRLLVLWDTGVEEDAHLENVHSTMSLADASSTGRARWLAQVVETELTPLGALAFVRTSAFICHGAGAIQVALAQENSFVVVNKYKASHSAYVLQPATHRVAQLVEGTLIVNDNESDPIAWPTPALFAATRGGGSGTAAALSFVPTNEYSLPLDSLAPPFTFDAAGHDAAVSTVCASPYEGFCEGMAVLNASPQAANVLAALLEALFTKLTTQTQLATVPHIISEAYLSGYTPSGNVTGPAIAAAVRLALSARFEAVLRDDDVAMPVLENPPYSLFCRFGRLYLQHRILHELRQRIVFVVITLLGDTGARTGEHRPEGTTALLAATLTQLLAAYHAAAVAGPELTNVLDAVHEDVVEALLTFLLFPYEGMWWESVTGGEDAVPVRRTNEAVATPSQVAVRVAARFARCHTPRCLKACLAWCVLLKPLYPILYHFDATRDIAAGRTGKSTDVLAAVMRVSECLAQLPVQDVLSMLITEGLLLTDCDNATCFSGIPTCELTDLVHDHPFLGPKLYVVGVLRRATPNGSLRAALSEPVVRNFFLTEMYQVWQIVRSLNRTAAIAASSPTSSASAVSGGAFAALTHAPLPLLQLALEELRVDVLCCLALASLDRGAMDIAFHDVQAALDAALQLGIANAYTDVVHQIVRQAVEVACASPAGVHALTVVSITSPLLRDLVVHRWYNSIARLPTKSASPATESRRFRSIMGLYRFLLNQHAYAQCGRVMTDLATLLRCSPLRMATSAVTHVSVGELANMALSAVELIDPIPPIVPAPSSALRSHHARAHGDVAGAAQIEDAQSEAGVQGMLGSPTSRLFGSPVSLGHSWAALNGTTGAAGAQAGGVMPPGMATEQRRWLSREDIPALQRRVYQAHCERKLWARGSTLNCTDIWVDGVRQAEFERGVQRLVEALMQHRLWEEAFRFATLSLCSDPCRVLTEWVKDLLEARRHVELARNTGLFAFAEAEEEEEGFAEMRYEWDQLIRCCQEMSTLDNQFRGFCMVVSAALTFDYGATLPKLRLAHCEADAYTSLVTLVEVIEYFRREEQRLTLGGAAEEDDQNGNDDEEGGQYPRRDAVRQDASRARTTSWLVWRDAVQVATALLHGERLFEVAAGVRIQIGVPRGTVARSADGVCILDGFTAGVFDPLARYSKELLAMPSSTLGAITNAQPVLQNAAAVAREYLAAIDDMKR